LIELSTIFITDFRVKFFKIEDNLGPERRCRKRQNGEG